MNFKLPQNFNYEAMRRQAKVDSKERLKHNQLPFWRRDIFSPWSPPDSVPKIAQTLHLQHAARVNPRGTKFDPMTVLQFHHRCRIANRLLRRRHGRGRGRSRRRRGRNGMVTYRRQRRAVCLTRSRSPAEQYQKRASKQRRKLGFFQRARKRVKGSRPSTTFYRPGAAPQEPNSPTVKRLINGHISKNPAQPLRARAAFSPSYDRLRHQLI